MIQFDKAGTKSVAAGSVLTWTHSPSTTNNNGIMFVQTLVNGTGTFTSFKFAGTAMTKVFAGTQVTNQVEVELWYLLNPPSGLGTFNGTFNQASPAEMDGLSLNYFGVDQVTPILGSARVLGTGVNNGSVTRSLSNVDSIWLGGMGFDNNTGSTNIGNQRGTAGNGGEIMGADALTGTLRWTNTNAASNWVIVAAEIAAAPRPTFQNLTGVGI